jgi:hypothetical protein
VDACVLGRCVDGVSLGCGRGEPDVTAVGLGWGFGVAGRRFGVLCRLVAGTGALSGVCAIDAGTGRTRR